MSVNNIEVFVCAIKMGVFLYYRINERGLNNLIFLFVGLFVYILDIQDSVILLQNCSIFWAGSFWYLKNEFAY